MTQRGCSLGPQSSRGGHNLLPRATGIPIWPAARGCARDCVAHVSIDIDWVSDFSPRLQIDEPIADTPGARKSPHPAVSLSVRGDVEMRCARLDVHRESSFRDSIALQSTEAVWGVRHRHVCLTRSRPGSGLRVGPGHHHPQPGIRSPWRLKTLEVSYDKCGRRRAVGRPEATVAFKAQLCVRVRPVCATFISVHAAGVSTRYVWLYMLTRSSASGLTATPPPPSLP
jgi:hypothetical protein